MTPNLLATFSKIITICFIVIVLVLILGTFGTGFTPDLDILHKLFTPTPSCYNLLNAAGQVVGTACH